MLFVELALIRWTAANNVYVTKATNFVLLASFLGIGIGFLNARSSRDFLRWTPLALLALVAFVLCFPVILALAVRAASVPGPVRPARAAPPGQPGRRLRAVHRGDGRLRPGRGPAVRQLPPAAAPTGWTSRAASPASRCSRCCPSWTRRRCPGAWSPRAAWSCCSARKSARWWQWAAAAVVVVLLGIESSAPHQVWSPYYKLSVGRSAGKDSALYVTANNIPYQAARSLAVLRNEKKFYFYPYQHVPRSSLKNVLIVGAGTGNDVAVALSEGAQHVDAVEIDPVLLGIGQSQAPGPPLRQPAGDRAHRRRPRVPAGHHEEVQPDPVRAARLADRGGRPVQHPAGELPAHRAVGAGGGEAAGPRRHVRDVQLLRAVPAQPVRHHDRRTCSTGRRAPRSGRRSAAAGWPCSPTGRTRRCPTAPPSGTAPGSPRPPTTTRSRTCTATRSRPVTCGCWA